MYRSFYHYLMTLRAPHSNPQADFADHAFYDASFPKQAQDYQTLSQYLEFVDYLPNMDIFDEVFTMYEENNR
ncbi:YozE family protein [Enterococcus timonensis]|uniref:YozE family protein n=1 Tax=Enterococcus timonensis TaxID=1852364 RepID=UPI0008D9DB0A|nr:YozE family protein [Enterococcus timonensis]